MQLQTCNPVFFCQVPPIPASLQPNPNSALASMDCRNMRFKFANMECGFRKHGLQICKHGLRICKHGVPICNHGMQEQKWFPVCVSHLKSGGQVSMLSRASLAPIFLSKAVFTAPRSLPIPKSPLETAP